MNTLQDLNELLFKQLNNISSVKTADEMEIEAKRTSSMVSVSKQIVDSAKLSLDAQVAVGDTISSTSLPPMLQIKR